MVRFILPVNSGEPEGLAPRFHGFKLRASGGARRLTSCKINVRQLKFFQTINVRHMNSTPETASDLSSHIAANIRDAIIKGVLIVDERLPSEAELSAQFNVSRATVREALKRLAAQSLIRTQRGATGGAFVNRISFEAAQAQQITTSTLLLSMNDVSFETACEARYTLERACAPLSARRRSADHLATMRAEIHRQGQPGLTDEAFCASVCGCRSDFRWRTSICLLLRAIKRTLVFV